MKLIVFFALFAICFQTFAMPVDVHGYLRSGVGNNLQNGKQSCFNNPGSEGNEFRLGNECSIYGETTFALEFLPKNDQNQSFKVQTTLAFFPNGNTQYGDESKTNDVDIVEAFVEAKNVEGIPYTYWVGKRFYRDVDLHMNDFYYFAAMSGVGAGVKDIPLFTGNFSAAYLQEIMTDASNNQLVKSYFDFRLFDIKFDKIGQLNLWSTIASAPKGIVDSKQYEKVDGQSVGFRLRNNVENGFNDFALIYGRNLMAALSVYGNGEVTAGNNNNHRYTVRAVEHLTKKLNDKWELHAEAIVEPKNSGLHDSLWWDLGARPVYFISDNLHFVTEVGHSEVKSHTSTLTLTRLTLAYEIALNKSIWARPVIRAFATETIWNNSNKSNFQGRSEGHAIGAQAEAWF